MSSKYGWIYVVYSSISPTTYFWITFTERYPIRRPQVQARVTIILGLRGNQDVQYQCTERQTPTKKDIRYMQL